MAKVTAKPSEGNLPLTLAQRQAGDRGQRWLQGVVDCCLVIDRVHLAVILMHLCHDQCLSRCHSQSLDFHILAGSFLRVDSQCMFFPS